MTRYLWAAPLIPHPVKPNLWEPAILPYQRDPAFSALGSPLALRWCTISAALPSPWAVGVCEINAAQFAVLDSDPALVIIIGTQRDQRMTTLGSFRPRINTFCDNAGIARPAAQDTIAFTWDRLAALIEPLKSLATLEAELDGDLGL